MRVAVVTLSLTPPADPTKVGHRELEFSPVSFNSPNPLTVATDAATVEVTLPIGPATGTLTDVSPHGVRSGSVTFSIDATPPDDTPADPSVPTVVSVVAGEVTDPPVSDASAAPAADPTLAQSAPEAAPEAAPAADGVPNADGAPAPAAPAE